MLVSSEHSDYSPVVTFAARVRVSDSIRVHVDQAKVLSPGDTFEGMGAIAGGVTIQALLVTESEQLQKGSVCDDADGCWAAIECHRVAPHRRASWHSAH